MPSEPETIQDPIEAVLASIRLWLLRAIAVLAAHFPNRLGRDNASDLRAYLRDVRYDLKRAIFLRAIARMPQTDPPTRHRPPSGYAVRRWKPSHFRFLTHGAFNRMPRDLLARLAHLRALSEDLDAITERLLKRLQRRRLRASFRKPLRSRRLFPTRPSARPSPDLHNAAVSPTAGAVRARATLGPLSRAQRERGRG
ncbi:MAG: hypothetical protein JNJ73_07880 [Hyphomonadaceae bacterium]|nr:hypothetical protein [Hyphomonadaceae bacterium]